tara:strand:- start:17 stop:211 length:195 start_codon:yes stop_codon:yes gene_type:complete
LEGANKTIKQMNTTTLKEFLIEDLKKLETDIKEKNQEEIKRFFFYWNRHIKSICKEKTVIKYKY